MAYSDSLASTTERNIRHWKYVLYYFIQQNSLAPHGKKTLFSMCKEESSVSTREPEMMTWAWRVESNWSSLGCWWCPLLEYSSLHQYTSMCLYRYCPFDSSSLHRVRTRFDCRVRVRSKRNQVQTDLVVAKFSVPSRKSDTCWRSLVWLTCPTALLVV